MCIALTSTRPSLTPLFFTAASTLGVMFSKPTRPLMWNVRYSVCDFMAREYPAHPVVGVGAVVVRDGRALVVRRAHEPRKGEWSLPGGLLDLGESLVDAARREVKEETGLDVEVGPMIETFDRVHRDRRGPHPLSLRDRRFRVLVERRRGRGRFGRRGGGLGHGRSRSTPTA